MVQTAFGPQGPNYTTTRPAADPQASGGIDTWFKNCSAAGAKDGTFATADFFNVNLGNLRYLVKQSGVALSDADDTMVYQAVQRIAGSNTFSLNYADDTGTPNNIVVSVPAITGISEGTQISIKVANDTTGQTTLRINSLPATVVVDNATGFDLGSGSLSAEGIYQFVYDGTRFRVAGANAVIDSAVTKTVHGPGADFTDIVTAFTWLSKFKITNNGSVLFNIAAGKWQGAPYNASIVLAHPNADRVTIAGAQPVGTLPTIANASSIFTTSSAQCLTNLRAILPTEIDFSGSVGAGFIIFGRALTIKNLLLVGDSSNSGAYNAGNGIMATGVTVFLQNVACHSFTYGIGSQSGGGIFVRGFASGTGCSQSGVAASDTSSVLTGEPGSLLVGCFNAGGGVSSSNGSMIRCNGTAGGNVYAFGNTLGGVSAGSNSALSIGLSGSVQSSSPAMNTTGNNNSFVTNSF